MASHKMTSKQLAERDQKNGNHKRRLPRYRIIHGDKYFTEVILPMAKELQEQKRRDAESRVIAMKETLKTVNGKIVDLTALQSSYVTIRKEQNKSE